MEKDIIANYGYYDFNDGLKIIKHISPYQSCTNKAGKFDLNCKLKEELSFQKINDLRKHLNFITLKNGMRLNVIR